MHTLELTDEERDFLLGVVQFWIQRSPVSTLVGKVRALGQPAPAPVEAPAVEAVEAPADTLDPVA